MKNDGITRAWGYLTPRKIMTNWPHPIAPDYASGLIQAWAGAMDDARRTTLPTVRAARLTTAAAIRTELAAAKRIGALSPYELGRPQ